MDENSVEKISELLSSPDVIKNVQSVLSQLTSSSNNDKPDIVIGDNNDTQLTDIMQTLSSNGLLSSITSFLSQNKTERIALLTALRPFLGEEKRGILDSIIQILKITNILTAANILN